MAFSDVLNAIETHATTAGAALTSPITNVKIGYPKPFNRAARIFWGGETDPVRMGDSPKVLNGIMVADLIVVMAWWALTTLSDEQAELVELEAQAFTAALRTAILGDSQLGGAKTDLVMRHGATDFIEINGVPWRVLTFEIVTDFSEYTLAP